jgi:5-methylcytosine-specific restriction endonuclease McrA
MANHVKVYTKHFGYGDQDFIPCEVCGGRSVDVHHIRYRSRGGDDDIHNLAALCRRCHDLCHAERITEEQMMETHLNFLKTKP